MRIRISATLLSAATALSLLAGCSNGSAVAPTATTAQNHRFHAMNGRVPSVVNPVGMLRLREIGMPSHKPSFDACPAAGPIVYVSDFALSTVSIYKVPFAGHAPCGVLTASSGLSNPESMIVRHNDLFVANTGGLNVLAFHRGEITPYITYADPNCSGEFPVDVTVSNDN